MPAKGSGGTFGFGNLPRDPTSEQSKLGRTRGKGARAQSRLGRTPAEAPAELSWLPEAASDRLAEHSRLAATPARRGSADRALEKKHGGLPPRDPSRGQGARCKRPMFGAQREANS